MLNFLVIAPHFPTPDIYENLDDDPRSKFLYEYIRQWSKKGVSITVLHLPPKYPSVFNHLASFASFVPLVKKLSLERYIQNRVGLVKKNFTHEGINIIRFPLTKFIPHSNSTRMQIKKLAKTIKSKEIIELDSYDAIFCDYLSPSAQLLDYLDVNRKVKVYPIIHQTDYSYYCKNPSIFSGYLSKADRILYRSKSLKSQFSAYGASLPESVYMFSGVPDNMDFGHVRSKVYKLLYVGTLRKSKNIHLIIQAAEFLKRMKFEFSLEIVGDGEYKENLVNLTESLKIDDCVTFSGKIPHQSIFNKMRSCDALVMVSKESFGMVYVEAMSQGCIVVAAKEQGIDGVITDHVNGLLVELNNQELLNSALSHLLSLDRISVESISSNSLNTAKSMTNSNLSHSLLADLELI